MNLRRPICSKIGNSPSLRQKLKLCSFQLDVLTWYFSLSVKMYLLIQEED